MEAIERGLTVTMARHTGMKRASSTGRTLRACRGRPRAFTLIELMMVMSIIALLATTAMMMMNFAGEDVRATVYNVNRRILEDQVTRYRLDHGSPPSQDRFREQITMATNRAGDIAAPGTPGYPYGPYLKEMPVNPYTGGSSVGISDSSDWHVEALTGNAEDLTSLSRRNLSQLYSAAATYLDERGSFPASLDVLRGEYIAEDTFQVVMISPRTGRIFSYKQPATTADDTVLIQETGAAPDLLICYADGRIEEGS
jgi:general secretion pathway protein G